MTPEHNDMTPDQVSILMQLKNVHQQIYELNRQAEQLTAAMLPVNNQKSKPFDRVEWRKELKRRGITK